MDMKNCNCPICIARRGYVVKKKKNVKKDWLRIFKLLVILGICCYCFFSDGFIQLFEINGVKFLKSNAKTHKKVVMKAKKKIIQPVVSVSTQPVVSVSVDLIDKKKETLLDQWKAKIMCDRDIQESLSEYFIALQNFQSDMAFIVILEKLDVSIKNSENYLVYFKKIILQVQKLLGLRIQIANLLGVLEQNEFGNLMRDLSQMQFVFSSNSINMGIEREWYSLIYRIVDQVSYHCGEETLRKENQEMYLKCKPAEYLHFVLNGEYLEILLSKLHKKIKEAGLRISYRNYLYMPEDIK